MEEHNVLLQHFKKSHCSLKILVLYKNIWQMTNIKYSRGLRPGTPSNNWAWHL